MLSPIVYFIYCIKKKLFLNILLILILTLGLNSLILSGVTMVLLAKGYFQDRFIMHHFVFFLFTFYIYF